VEEQGATAYQGAHLCHAADRRRYLAGTNTRRVRRALGLPVWRRVGKDTVSRVWRKVKSDWDAWNPVAWRRADRAADLDGTVVRVGWTAKSDSVSLLVVLGVARTARSVARDQGMARSSEAWPPFSDDLINRGLRGPSSSSSNGAPVSTRRLLPCGRVRSSDARSTAQEPSGACTEALHDEVTAITPT